MAAGALTAEPTDAPSVVLIHGLGGSHQTWDPVVALIETEARVRALNLAGSRSIDREADEAARLIEGPSVLAGHSRGALVATALAERHPQLVRSLLLICPPWAPGSRLSAGRPSERALWIPGLGRRRLVAASRAIDDYLAEAPLAARLEAIDVPVELMFAQHDDRVALPPENLFAPRETTVLADVGHTPPWEAPELVASRILFSARPAAVAQQPRSRG